MSHHIFFILTVKTLLESGHGTLDPLCVGLVAMAAINIIATQQTVTMTTHHKLMTSLASDVILLLEKYQFDSTQVNIFIIKLAYISISA